MSTSRTGPSTCHETDGAPYLVMPMNRKKSLTAYLSLCLVVLVFLVVAVAAVLSYLRPERRPPTYVTVLFAVAFAFAVVFGWLWPALLRRRVRRLLAPRPPLDAAAFGETYFRDLPRGPELAAAVRRHLQPYAGIDLAGLRPDDRLNEVAPELDPLFFDDLAEELGFRLPEKYPELSAETASIRTVRDLVEYLARKAGGESG